MMNYRSASRKWLLCATTPTEKEEFDLINIISKLEIKLIYSVK